MGMLAGSTIKYKFNGDEFQSTILTVQIEEICHEVFKRDGQNLIVRQDVTVYDALYGFEKYLKTLDKRTLILKKEQGVKTEDKSKMVIKGEGFPYYQNGEYKTGDLLVFFRVLPDQLTPDLREQKSIRNMVGFGLV